MGRPRDFLDILEDPKAAPLGERRPGDELLLGLLAHMLYADGEVTSDELRVVGRLTGRTDDEELREYLDELGERPLDYDELARAFPDPQDRDDIVTLAEHAIWGDDRVEGREVDLIEDLMEALGVKPG
ncbi:MAG: TerB family tellurite resistance protein [Myxococcales bacterium]|nr:TerB family tellurite resistance protein [Myxococcales bacterium]